MIPAKIKSYFWEVDTKKLNPKKNPEYIISRVLEYGRPDAIRWVWRNFSKKEWLSALKLRETSSKTKRFWLSIVLKKK